MTSGRSCGRRAISIAIAITGVLAATIAAYFPARSAAKVPVLSALAGRRPLGALPRAIVPIGIALFGGGVLVLSLVAAASQNGGGNSLAAAAVFGGLLVLSGACCVSPVLVASLAHVGRRLRGAGRVALRSIVRNRARSAAVVMALAAINGGAIAIGTAFASRTETKGVARVHARQRARADSAHDRGLAHLVADIACPSIRRSSASCEPSCPKRRGTTGARSREPWATTATRFPAARFPAGGKRAFAVGLPDTIVVADPPVLALIGLAASDAATLQRVGAMVLPDQGPTNNSLPSTITVGTGASAQDDHRRPSRGSCPRDRGHSRVDHPGGSAATQCIRRLGGFDRHEPNSVQRVSAGVDRRAGAVDHVRRERRAEPRARRHHGTALVGTTPD